MRTLLLVEPNLMLRELLCAALTRAGFETRSVSTSSEALAVIASQPHDIIIVEPNMKGMDGFWLLEHLRAHQTTASTPVIVLTDLAQRSKVVKAARFGVDAYLLKSAFRIEAFLHLIQSRLPSLGASTGGQDPDPTSAPTSPTAALASPTNRSAVSAPSTPIRPTLNKGTSDGAQSLQSIKPLLTRKAIKACIAQCSEVKAMSPGVSHLLKVTGSSSCTVERVVEAVKMDHAIALKILKLANSPLYARGASVDSVRDAVLRIGIAQIRHTVMGITIVDSYASSRLDDLLNIHHFWEHGLACGVVASQIAMHTNVLPPDTAFTLGLLHDIGRLVLAEHLGDVYAEVIQMADHFLCPLDKVEKRMLHLSHADVMDRLLLAWHFPKALVHPILMHHHTAADIQQASRTQAREAMVLALADRFTHALLLGHSGNRMIEPLTPFASRLRLTDDALASIETVVDEQATKMKYAVLSTTDVDPGNPFQSICRDSIGGHFSPVFVGTQPQADPVRMLCDRLSTCEPSDGYPTVLIVHITSPREIDTVSHLIARQDQESGQQSLPIICISHDGSLLPEPQTISDRVTHSLPFPFHLNQLIAAASECSATLCMTRAA